MMVVGGTCACYLFFRPLLLGGVFFYLSEPKHFVDIFTQKTFDHYLTAVTIVFVPGLCPIFVRHASSVYNYVSVSSEVDPGKY